MQEITTKEKSRAASFYYGQVGWFLLNIFTAGFGSDIGVPTSKEMDSAFLKFHYQKANKLVFLDVGCVIFLILGVALNRFSGNIIFLALLLGVLRIFLSLVGAWEAKTGKTNSWF